MSQQIINIGAAPNDGTGDPARNAFSKVNANFTEVYTDVSDLDTRIDGLQYSQIGGLPALGTAATRNVGTDSGNVVEVLAGNKLPALDGSNLTNISGGGGGGSITIDGIPEDGQVAFWTASNHLEGRVLVAADISDLETATGIPGGGGTGQLLAKNSGTDYDTTWITAPTSLPAGGVSGQALLKNSSTDGDASWQTLPSSGAGDVVGPASSVNGRAVIFSGTTGKVIVQASAAPVLEGDSRLTNSRGIANGDYVDFAVDTGVAQIDRSTRTLEKVAGYDSGGLVGSMDLEDTNEVADTLNYNDVSNIPSNMTASGLATWAGPYISDYLSMNTYSKQPVRAVDFQASATLSTAYANGQVVGGVTVATGDSILLAGRSTGSQNGVYIVPASGSPVRRTDADTSAELKGAVYLCLEGISSGRLFRNTNASTITVGSTSITYSEIPGTATVAEVITGTDAVKQITPATLAGFIGKGSNVAAAATTTLGNGDYFHITGTTGITAFAFTNDRAGRSATLYFEGAVLITNSGSLITASGETFTTTAGDTFLLVSEGSGVFRLFPLKRAKGILALGSVSGNFGIPILSHHSGITVTLTGNSTINAISGLIDGGLMGTIELFVTQGGSGSYTLTDSIGALTPMGSDAYTLVPTVGATTILLLQGTPGGNFFIMNTGRSY